MNSNVTCELFPPLHVSVAPRRLGLSGTSARDVILSNYISML